MRNLTYLGGINDTSLQHVNKLSTKSIITSIDIVGLNNLIDDDRCIKAGVFSNLKHGLGQGMTDDVDTSLLVFVSNWNIVKDVQATGKSGTTSRNNTWKNVKLRLDFVEI